MCPALKTGEMGKDVTKILSSSGRRKKKEGKKKKTQQKKMLYIKFCCVEERAGCCSGKAGGRPAGPRPPWTTSLLPSLQTHVRSESEQRQLVEQGREEHEEAVKCC